MKVYFYILVLTLFLFNQGYAICPQAELNALNAFYLSTSSWLGEFEGWSPAYTDCCNRTGVTCNEQDSVVGLNLTDMYLFNNNDPSTFDLTDLTNLETFTLPGHSFSIGDMTLPQSIKNLNLLGCTLDSYIQANFNYPNLEILQFNSWSGVFHIFIDLPNLAYLYIPQINFQYNFTKIPNIQSIKFRAIGPISVLEDLCTLEKLKMIDLSIDNSNYTKLPACLLEKPLVQLNLQQVTIQDEFPELPNTLQEFQMSDCEFTTFPTVLPPNIKVFSCDYCFDGTTNYTIPQEWSQNEELIAVTLHDSQIEGIIPSFLIERLVYGDFGFTYVENDVNDFLKVRETSFWDLRRAPIKGRISEDFQYLLNGTSLQFEHSEIVGNLPRFAYCNTDYLDFSPMPNLLDTPDDLINELYVEFYYPENDFNYIQNDYFCFDSYQDPFSIDYVTPVSELGGMITIKNDRFIFRQPSELMMAQEKKESPRVKYSDRIKKTTSETINSDKTSINIGFNTDLNNDEGEKVGALEGPYDNIVYDWPSYDPYHQFKQTRYIEVVGGDDLFKLHCRFLSLKSIVECNNFPPKPTNETITYVMTLYTEQGYYLYEWDEFEFIPAPLISNITVDDFNDQITIRGSNFGNGDQISDSKVTLFANGLESLDCSIISKNNEMIICHKDSENQNSDAIYNALVTINHQTSNVLQIVYQGDFTDSPSSCYGDSDMAVCQSRGQCSDAQLCMCNSGFRGIFCEVTDSSVTNSNAEKDGSSPTGTFDHPDATAKFTISISQIRELDFRSRIVANYTPEWSLLSSEGPTSVYQASIQSGATIQASIEVIPESKTVEFGNASIQTDPNTLKYSVSINGYKFISTTNSLQVIFAMSAEPSSSIQDKCAEDSVSDSKFTQDPNQDDVKWVQIERGNSNLLGKIISRSVLDNRVIYIKFNSEFVNDNEMNLVANIPYFSTSAIIDPSYAALLNPDSESSVPSESQCKKSNSWKIATGVVVGVVGAVGLAVGGYILYKKKLAETEFMQKLRIATGSK